MTELLKPSRASSLWTPGGQSRLWKRGDPSGLPRNGLVALYDPYCDAYGLDESARLALQTGVDYSGRGNTLTYGGTTGASTDDPVNTGTAWSFDGGDYLLANGLRDALKGKTRFTLAVVLNQSSLASSRGILSGAATGSSMLGVNFCDDTASPYYPTIIVNDGTTSAKALLSTYDTGGNRLIIARFIGGTELAIKNAGETWVKDETNVPPYVKQAIDVDWAIGALDITGTIKGLVGTMPLFVAWNWAIPDGGIARIENAINGLMTQRGVTLA